MTTERSQEARTLADLTEEIVSEVEEILDDSISLHQQHRDLTQILHARLADYALSVRLEGKIEGLKDAARYCDVDANRYRLLQEDTTISSLKEAYGEKAWVLEVRSTELRNCIAALEAEGAKKI